MQFSTVIVSRNRHQLLDRALKSVATTSRAAGERKIEVIVIDNFSDVPIVIEKFDPIICLQVIRNEEILTASENRNIGIAASSGKFISFLDDDDYFYENKFSDIAAEIEKGEGYDFFYGATEQLGEGGVHICRSFGPAEITNLLHYRYIHLNSIVISRSALQGVKFNESMETYEDLEFVANLVLKYRGKAIDRYHSCWIRDNRTDQLTNRNYARAYRNWLILCKNFHNVIVRSSHLTFFYYKKMFILSLIQMKLGCALRSLAIIGKVKLIQFKGSCQKR